MKFKFDFLFIKFILVGCINTLFGYGVYALALLAGLHYSIACILSAILGILFNFKTTGVLVFKNHNNNLFFKFISVYILTTFLSILFLKIANSFKLNLYFIGLIITGVMAIISFTLQKYFVFRKEDV